MLRAALERANMVAMGESEADLVVRGARVVSVYTGEVLENTDVAVAGDTIAYVGPDASHAAGPRTRVLEARGRYLVPGLADPHTHIDQFVLPHELAARSLLRGVTSLFSDPIDAVAVAGEAGFAEFRRLCRGLPARIFNSVPGGLPVDPEFGHGRTLSPARARAAAREPDVPGLGEVFSWTRVTSRDPATMGLVSAVLGSGGAVNGHTAGASGKKLNAYAGSGIISCHEPIDYAQAVERLRLGMWVMVREGSIRRDLAAIMSEVVSRGLRTDRLMFCSDGLDPVELGSAGHIDRCVREAVRLGVPPAEAVIMGSRNCFDYYGMGARLGGIAPGRLADMVITGDIAGFCPSDVFVGGRHVVSGGRLAVPFPRRAPGPALRGTVRAGPVREADLAVPASGDEAEANVVRLSTPIVTSLERAAVPVRGGSASADPARGICKAAAFDRSGRTRARAVGFLSGMGLESGALASTWNFHENDLLVVGADERDMAAAAAAVSGGGMAAVRSGRIKARLRLQAGGIMSTGRFDDVARELEGFNEAARALGCPHPRPHVPMIFLPFLALPRARILHSGIIDVIRRERVPPLAGDGPGRGAPRQRGPAPRATRAAPMRARRKAGQKPLKPNARAPRT